MNSKQLTITYSFVRRIAFIYISLPLFCFFIGWLKWYFAVLSCLALIVCIFMSEENGILKRLFNGKASVDTEGVPTTSRDPEKSITISKKVLAAVVLISCIYLIFCGMGRLWAQSDDYPWRNAIFRDLIVRGWPVFYDKYNGALCYYIGSWLPAAIPGKIAYLICGNTETAFFVGNISILVFYTVGLTILFLLLFMYFQTTKVKQMFVVLIGFIFFSGMDFFGFSLTPEYLHVEWWAVSFQYSSFTTCICWVFNQALIPWMCTILLLHEKKLSGFVFIGMACLFVGPFPFVGLFIYCIFFGIKRGVGLLKAKEGKCLIKEIFSVSNMCAVLAVFPFIGSYLLSNTFMSNGTDGAGSSTAFFEWDMWTAYRYLLFVLLEFGIYAILIARQNQKNLLYYVTIAQLLIYPFFKIGINSDFTMRASIPAIFMMYIFCYQYLLTEKAKVSKKAAGRSSNPKKGKPSYEVNLFYVTLVVLLFIGAYTPGVEFFRGIVQVNKKGINDPSTDYIITLNLDHNPVDKYEPWPPTNFVALDPDNILFFKYFARR